MKRIHINPPLSKPGIESVQVETLPFFVRVLYWDNLFCQGSLKRERREKGCGTDCGNRAGTWKNRSRRAGVVRNQARPPSSVPLSYILLMNALSFARVPWRGGVGRRIVGQIAATVQALGKIKAVVRELFATRHGRRHLFHSRVCSSWTLFLLPEYLEEG